MHPETPLARIENTSISTPPGFVSHHSDETLIRLWLNGRSQHTQRSYEADVRGMLATVMKPVAGITLGDLHDWIGTLSAMAPASQARKIGAAKSLLAFGHRTGLLSFNVGAALRVPPVKNVLAERILDETDVIRLIALETDKRNHAILRLGYIGGLRVSEICGLKWRDTKRRTGGGQITVFGKGGKTRVVVLPGAMWKELAALRSETDGEDDPAFRSAKGGHLDPSAVHRVVKHAAKRAGLPSTVSAHYLRHAHVSHALDRGAPAHLVQATVGHSDLRTTSKYAHAKPDSSSSTYLIG